MNTGHKEAARDESRGGFLGVSNCGGDHLIAVSAQRACCGGDDEVIDGVCRDAIRLDNADESAGAVAVHCVSSRLRAGCKTPEDPRQHQCDRVGVLNCGAGLQERETLARWRPARGLGRVGALGCAKAVPASHRLQTGSNASSSLMSAGTCLFRRVIGYKQVPALIRELEALAPPKPEVA